MDGLILVDKPQGPTSHDIVARIRKILQVERVGHFGTLDPLATGLLLVAVGKATRLFPLFSKTNKLYSGRIRLGFSTDTYDALGKSTSGEKTCFPDHDTLTKAMNTFVGKIMQIPPPFSAKKFRGKPLYKLARAKKIAPLRPNPVRVYAFDLKEYSPPLLDFESRCSSGTYMRSLAHDLGEILGCGAHLASLRRLAAGGYTLSTSHSLEQIEKLAQDGKIPGFLLPLETLLQEHPKIILNESGRRELQKGKALSAAGIFKVLEPGLPFSPGDEEEEAVSRLFSLEGKFLALAKKDQGQEGLIPFLLLS
jgi:tRNA pseudouridine55 synthase